MHRSTTRSGSDVVLVSGSGGGAALAADHLDAAGFKLAELHPSTRERIKSVLPEFGDVTNPIDVTGAVFYDPTIMTRLLDAVVSDPGRPIIATAVNAAPAPHDRMRRIADAVADTARSSGRTIVAYQVSPLGPVDGELVASLHAARRAVSHGDRQQHGRAQAFAAPAGVRGADRRSALTQRHVRGPPAGIF